VRFYLNGVHLRAEGDRLTLTATDGHRLARAWAALAEPVRDPLEAILHRTPVLDLARHLRNSERPLTLTLSEKHWGVQLATATLSSRLIDGKYPDADRVIPRQLDQTAALPVADLRRAIEACGILSNEQYKGVRFEFSPGQLSLSARNEQGEEATELVEIEYAGPGVGIGYNLVYVLDLLKAVDTETLAFLFTDSNSSALAHGEGAHGETFVVMPMRM
jgi:DNA polymerase-3 subunit beta